MAPSCAALASILLAVHGIDSIEAFSCSGGARWFGPRKPHVALAAAMEGGSGSRQLLHIAVPTTNVEKNAAFLSHACGMSVQRTDSIGSTFVGFGPEADGEHFALKLVPATEDASPDDVLSGFSVAVADIQAAMTAAKKAGGEVVRPVDNVTFPASLVPDEDVDAQKPWQLRAVVRDPYSNLEVEFVEHSKPLKAGHQTDASLTHVTLNVMDLQDSLSYFTEGLGMTLHRQRALLPVEPAMSAWLSYAPEEHGGTLLELRYTYGRTFGRNKARTPKRTAVVSISVPDVDEVAVELTGIPRSESIGAEEGVALFPAKSPSKGLEVMVIDELHFLKQTLL